MQDRLITFREQAYERGFSGHHSPKEDNLSHADLGPVLPFEIPVEEESLVGDPRV